jgi:hypothetical protein
MPADLVCGSPASQVKQNCSRCSHGPVGRLPSVKRIAEVDRPQVRTTDGFVPRRTGGYNIYEIALTSKSEICVVGRPQRLPVQLGQAIDVD